MLGSMLAESYDTNKLLFSFLYTCEEFLEMLCIAIFIYALLLYINSQFKVVTITVHSPNSLNLDYKYKGRNII